jgi:hypothetical protein
MTGVRRRFWIEAGLGTASFALLVLTLVWHDWIETVFGADPDQGSGFAEWLIVAILALVAVTFAVLARIDFRRLRAAAAPAS